jgi:hypothetical protein
MIFKRQQPAPTNYFPRLDFLSVIQPKCTVGVVITKSGCFLLLGVENEIC